MFLKTVQQAKRFFVIVAGFIVLLTGIAMLVTPGPGLAVIIAGLAMLAVEFVWARRLLDRIKRHGGQIRDAILPRDSNPGNRSSSWFRRLLDRLRRVGLSKHKSDPGNRPGKDESGPAPQNPQQT